MYRFVIEIAFYYSAFAVVASLFFAFPEVLVRYSPCRLPEKWRKFVIRLKSNILKIFQKNIILKSLNKIWHGILTIALAPFIYGYDIVDKLVSGLIRLNNKIDDNTFFHFVAAYERRFGVEFSKVSNNDRFWLPYLELHRADPSVARRIDEIRGFANFCRNQSFAFFVASLLVTGIYRSGNDDLIGIYTRSDVSLLAVMLFFLAWLFHWKFLHHYYSFTKMTFRAFSARASTATAKPRATKRAGATKKNVGSQETPSE